MKILLRPQKSLDGLKNAGKPRKAVSQSTALRLQMLNLERKDKEKPMFYLFVNFPWLVMMPHLVPTTQYFPLMSPNFLARGTSYWPYASEWDRKNIKISKTWELPSPWLSSAWQLIDNLREEKRGTTSGRKREDPGNEVVWLTEKWCRSQSSRKIEHRWYISDIFALKRKLFSDANIVSPCLLTHCSVKWSLGWICIQ